MTFALRGLAAVALVAAAACASGDGIDAGESPVASASPTGPVRDITEDFAPCPPPPSPVEYELVGELTLPDEAIVTNVNETGPLTQFSGFVAMSPQQWREHYEALDYEIITAEDEGYEAELLLGSGGYNYFVKAVAQCRFGSAMAVVVAPASDTGSLPTPAGGS